MKVALNNYFGEFALSSRAAELIVERGAGEILLDSEIKPGQQSYRIKDATIKTRSNPVLIEVIEELTVNANGTRAALAIVDIDDEVAENAYIDNYNGIETVHEEHRVWNALHRPSTIKLHGHDSW